MGSRAVVVAARVEAGCLCVSEGIGGRELVSRMLMGVQYI